MVIVFIGIDFKTCFNILVIIYIFNSEVFIQKVCDFVFERVDKINFLYSLSGRNENIIVINYDNEMSRLVNFIKDGLFCF